MFTGLVEGMATVSAIRPRAENGARDIVLTPSDSAFAAKLGDSVAVNGCCLTVTHNQDGKLSFEVSRETADKTTLAALKAGDHVNLERALALGDRLGGHIVTGHVDGVGEVRRFERREGGSELDVFLPKAAAPFVVEKGSICLDGVSLTINRVVDEAEGAVISLMLITETLTRTTLATLKSGRKINYEVDLLAKHLERIARFSR